MQIATTHSCIICSGVGHIRNKLWFKKKCSECNGQGSIVSGSSIEFARELYARKWHGFKAWFWNVDLTTESIVISRQN